MGYIHVWNYGSCNIFSSPCLLLLPEHNWCIQMGWRENHFALLKSSGLPDLSGMFTDILPKPDDLPPLTHFELVYHTKFIMTV